MKTLIILVGIAVVGCGILEKEDDNSTPEPIPCTSYSDCSSIASCIGGRCIEGSTIQFRVHGQVTSWHNGESVSGVAVRLSGNTDTTDADGNFSVATNSEGTHDLYFLGNNRFIDMTREISISSRDREYNIEAVSMPWTQVTLNVGGRILDDYGGSGRASNGEVELNVRFEDELYCNGHGEVLELWLSLRQVGDQAVSNRTILRIGRAAQCLGTATLNSARITTSGTRFIAYVEGSAEFEVDGCRCLTDESIHASFSIIQSSAVRIGSVDEDYLPPL